MDTLRDAIAQNGPLVLALGGLAVGFLFGAVVFATNFCAMGSLSDIHNFGDWRRFRAWILAGATALIGAQLLQAAGVVALDKSMYLASANINWAGHILGGLLFGLGMVFTGGCPSRNLARAGAGDLRSLVTLLVLGLFAYMAIRGIFAPARAALEQATSLTGLPSQSLGDLLATSARLTSVTGAPSRHGSARRRRPRLLLRQQEVSAPRRCTFSPGWPSASSSSPAGRSPALPTTTWRPSRWRPSRSPTCALPAMPCNGWCCSRPIPMPGFGTASVFGALLGACVAALAMGRFRIATFSDTGDTLRNLAGAALMGLGGVMALGCTIGQGITGISTLALGSFLTFAAIVAGGFWGLRLLERQIMASA